MKIQLEFEDRQAAHTFYDVAKVLHGLADRERLDALVSQRHSTDLLLARDGCSGSKLSAMKLNKVLVERGVLKEIKLRGSKTPRKIFAEQDSVYGTNIRKSDRNNDYEARYYIESFQALLDWA